MSANFNWTVRVYYEDTDTGGIVFHANHLKFFERARTEWLHATGISQRLLVVVESHQVMFIVKSSALDYHAPAKLDDELKLIVVVERLGRASVQYIQKAWRVGTEQPQLLTDARIKIGCVDCRTFRACPIPNEVLERIKSTGSVSR